MVNRENLVIGKKYYLDNSRQDIGVFTGRDVDAVYFDCGKNSSYFTFDNGKWKGLVGFMLEGDGFDEVLIGDDLTDENLELIESILEK